MALLEPLPVLAVGIYAGAMLSARVRRRLKEGGRREGFTDNQRRRLAAKGKPLSREVLDRSPDRPMSW